MNIIEQIRHSEFEIEWIAEKWKKELERVRNKVENTQYGYSEINKVVDQMNELYDSAREKVVVCVNELLEIDRTARIELEQEENKGPIICLMYQLSDKTTDILKDFEVDYGVNDISGVAKMKVEIPENVILCKNFWEKQFYASDQARHYRDERRRKEKEAEQRKKDAEKKKEEEKTKKWEKEYEIIKSKREESILRAREELDETAKNRSKEAHNEYNSKINEAEVRLKQKRSELEELMISKQNCNVLNFMAVLKYKKEIKICQKEMLEIEKEYNGLNEALELKLNKIEDDKNNQMKLRMKTIEKELQLPLSPTEEKECKKARDYFKKANSTIQQAIYMFEDYLDSSENGELTAEELRENLLEIMLEEEASKSRVSNILSQAVKARYFATRIENKKTYYYQINKVEL